MQVGDRADVLGPELVPTRSVGCRVAGEHRRDGRVCHLERIAVHDPDPRPAGVVDRRKADDVVLDDDVWLDLGEDLAEAVVDVATAVAQRPPGRLDERRELLDRRLPEHRRLGHGSQYARPRLTPGAPVLQLRGVTGGKISEPLDLEARSGEVLGIAGLAGSGRSTLLRLLFGTQTRHGDVFVDGRLVKGREADAIRDGICDAAQAGAKNQTQSRRPRRDALHGLDSLGDLESQTFHRAGRTLSGIRVPAPREAGHGANRTDRPGATA